MSLIIRRRRKPEINIVPLIDVLTILIFFFMVMTQFREVRAMQITLPQMETAGTVEVQDKLELAIDAEGNLFLSNQPVSREALRGVLQELKPLHRDVTVLVRADENTPIRLVTEVMDACRQSSFDRIRLVTRKQD